MSFSCGIDFGTTNTATAIVVNKSKPKSVILENNNITIPSALFFNENNQVYFGRQAMQMYIDGQEGRCMRSLKRILGSDLMSSGTLVNGQLKSFSEILALFLKNIKNKIDTTAQNNIENVVLGRPVHFQNNDEKADIRAENQLRKIAENIGFKNIEFQYEPIAAAFAHEASILTEKVALVIDIGGGTSDFTVLRLGQNLTTKADRKDDILASTGTRIGGNDFDKDLSIKCFMPTFGYKTLQGQQSPFDKVMILPTDPYMKMAEWSSINSMYCYKELNDAKKMLYNAMEKEKVSRFVELIEKERGYLLLNMVENCKIDLTSAENLNMKLDFISGCPQIEVTKTDFEDGITDNINRIFKQISECLKLAQTEPEKIELIVLTGGSTQIKLIQNLISVRFPNALISQEDKFSSVSTGLAYDSMRKFK